MLYMVIEKFRPGKKSAVYDRYHAFGRMLPEGLDYVASRVETEGDRCFQIMRTQDRDLFAAWTSNWDDLVDFEIISISESPTPNPD